MRKALYTLGVQAYGLAIRLAARFNSKAQLWVSGRKGLREKLQQLTLQHPIWVHCASLGEFEQGRSIIEAIRAKHPDIPLVVSFFSPSGFELRKDYDGADAVVYLPLDTPANAQHFVDTLQPRLALFIKYELWLNLIAVLQTQNIPHAVVAANLGPESKFLRGWQRSLYVSALEQMTHVFVQRAEQVDDLKREFNWTHVSYSGDPRADRVAQIVAQAEPIDAVANWLGDRECLVCGSTWPADEKLIATAWHGLPESDRPRLIIAPHELGEDHLAAIEQLFQTGVVRYSQLATQNEVNASPVLIIDNIGMLARIYAYGQLAYVGGGFGSGIHNTLEPAAHGVGVVFGPKYKRFNEALDLIAEGAAVSVEQPEQFTRLIQSLRLQPERAELMGTAAGRYVQRQRGATERVLRWVEDVLKLADENASE